MKVLSLFAVLCCCASPASAVPVINEFLAINHGPSLDDFAQASDWIEIRNPGPGSVDLAGWSLTDEPDLPAKWIFPAVTLEEGTVLQVYASGRDRRDPGQSLHTNFTLSGEGEFLGLYSPASVASTIWQPYPKQFSGISYGIVAGGTVQGYFPEPTPNSDNQAAALSDYVRDTRFSAERRFYSAPFLVTVTCDTPGASIYYTTDGSEPTENSSLYTAPLTITTTTVLRVRAFKAGLVASNVDTQSYIFAETWRTQPALPVGFPATWGQATAPFQAFKNTAVYRMHTAITNSPDYTALILPALTDTLPVLCLTGNREELLGDGGIHGDLRHTDIEVPVGVEFFNPQNEAERFSARGALQAHGGAVRDHAKKAFRLDFTGAFGNGPLSFPLFAGSKSESFDQLVLRPGGHDAFSAPGRDNAINDLDLPWHASYLRDQFLRRTENEMGLLSPRGRYVHLCINGLYWGLYELHERPNAEFCVSNAGGEPEAWDVLHHNNFISGGGPQVVDGDDTAWSELQALSEAPVVTDTVYQQLAALLGPDRFIDHLLVRMWAGDYDWLGPAYDPNITENVSAFTSKNWYAVRASRSQPAGEWQLFTWDAEISMGTHLLPELINSRNDIFFPSYLQRKLDLDLTRISRANTPAAPWNALRAHPEFRSKVADRAHRLLDNNGALSQAAAQARLDVLIQQLDLPVVAESARWAAVSGNKGGRGLGNWNSSPIMNRNTHWRPEVAWLRDVFAVQRRGIFRAQLQAQNLYPLIEPVSVTPFGGNVGPGETIELSAPAGTIYYTTDGTDPRQALTGQISPGAIVYDSGTPISTGGASPFTIKTRAFTTEWSPLTEVTFTSAAPPTPEALAITEIHYHPADPSAEEITAGFTDADDFEFLEITNISAQAVALDSLRFAAGIDFDFALHSTLKELAPGASLVIASNAAAFQQRYGFAPAGAFANGTHLSNSGEQIKLVTEDGLTIVDVTYNDSGEWPAAADGEGRSLELLAPASGTVEDDADHWRPGSQTGGNPGVVSPLTYAAWLGDYFTAAEIADPLVTGALANPEGDGMANLSEYATRTNPRKTSNHPVKVATLPGGGTRFTWERRADAADIAGELQLSTALQSWLPAGGDGISVSNENTTRGTILQTVDCTAATGVRFARLRLTLTP
jgi:hypothetical protein